MLEDYTKCPLLNTSVLVLHSKVVSSLTKTGKWCKLLHSNIVFEFLDLGMCIRFRGSGQ